MAMDAEIFAALPPIPETVLIGEETLDITPLKVGELPAFARAVRPVAAKLGPDPDWAPKRNQTLLVSGGVALVGAAIGVAGGVLSFRNAGHTRIAPAPRAGNAPPGLELVAVGVAPSDGGGRLGAVFSF